MLHWKITNRGFALWRCQEHTKLNNYKAEAQGMWTQLRSSISKLQGLLDVQVPCSWTLQSLEWGRGSELLWGSSTHHPETQISELQHSLYLFFWLFCREGSACLFQHPLKTRTQVGKSLFSLLYVSKRSPRAGDLYDLGVIQTLIISKYMRNSKLAQKRHPRCKNKK